MVTGQPNKTTDTKNSSANEKPKPTRSTVILDNNEGPAKTADKADGNPPHWYTALERPDWWIVIIAALTGGAIVYQAKEMARATEVMRITVSLQEAALMQWVSVGNWKCFHVQTNPPSPPATSLLIEFDVANESNFPLTINGEFRFLGNLPGAKRFYTTQKGITLFPRKPYKCDVSLNITDEQSRQYFDSALRISVHGRMTHLGVSNKRSPLMSIDGNLVCRRNAPTELEYESISMTPAEK
jgi:hypothetical protein